MFFFFVGIHHLLVTVINLNNQIMTPESGIDSLRLYNKEIKSPPLCSKKTESLWGARWGVGGCVLLPTKICSRVCIGSFCRFTAVSLHGFRKSAKESPTNHLWS